MANIRDITGKNRQFTGTGGIKVPSGTQAQRVNTAGTIRFNTDTNLAEYYDGTDWKPIDAPPTITGFTIDGGSSVTSGVVDNTAGGNASFVINGSNFDATSGTVVFEPESGGSNVSVQSITRSNSSSFTVTVTRSDFVEANDPYAIKLSNGSGLAATLASAIDVNVPPSFATSADTNIGSVYQGVSDHSGLTTVAATDADGDAITHTISAGSIPSGMSLTTAGAFTGTVGSDTAGTFTFTVSAATSNGTATRQFTMNYSPAAADAEYTSSGSYTYTVPTGVTNVSVVCIGGGGGGGLGNSGQAGGGGALAYRNNITVVPGQTASITVGSGGSLSGTAGTAGGSSSFTYDGTTTTAGGGGGATNDGSPAGSNGSGGSGGTRSGTTDGGGNGGSGGTDPGNFGGPGGGGAGGYSGNGGAGASKPSGSAVNGSGGSGGGGGGGGCGGQSEVGGGGGGGVGFYGQGTSGSGGIGHPQNATPGTGGGGGSGGTTGSTGSTSGPGGSGGSYGGGHGGCQVTVQAGSAGSGAVRVIYHPAGASFPSTNVGNV